MSTVIQLEKGLIEQFKEHGFVHISGISDAQEFCDAFLSEVRDCWPFGAKIVLDNVARVPHRSCEDAITTDHLSLHFEMGLPVVAMEEKTRVHALLCLHIPLGEPASPVKTRLLPIRGLLAGKSDVGKHLVSYVQKHGAGWGELNSGRLLVAAQLIDTFQSVAELGYMREHRIAEWFNRDSKGGAQDGLATEHAFFSKNQINLAAHEKTVQLQSGDLLIVDNLRVAHGRKGKRPAEELLQLLYGAKEVSQSEIAALRENTVLLLTR